MNTEQFSRISLLIGDDNTASLLASHVLVVGMGAVGTMAIEALARSGVGNFTLVDFDTISISNINRQIIATWDTVGLSKVDESKKRIISINKDANVRTKKLFFSEDTVDDIFDVKYDLVIDAIDSLNPKCLLLEYCYKHNIKIISSMGAALRRNPSLIRCEDLFDSYGDRLAKLMRKRMKNRGVGRGIKVVFSPEVTRFDFKTASSTDKEETLERGRKRNVLGSLPSITGIFGLTLAHYALSMLCDEKEFSGLMAIKKK
jgi:tRNA A37 threonylcarbamoyladenosine dehydratase